MKCPSCEYVSLERLEICGNCGAPMSRVAHAPAQPILPIVAGSVDARPWLAADVAAMTFPEPPVAPARVRGGTKRRRGSRQPVAPPSESQGSSGDTARVDDFFKPLVVGDDELDVPVAPLFRVEHPVVTVRQREPVPLLPPPPADAAGVAAAAEDPPIIDRAEEVPDRFWAAEGAGFLRRSAALLVDLILLGTLLGLFLLGAALALERAGLEGSSLFSGPGLRAALLPLALLAALLSLGYHIPFEAIAARTPGKLLAGLEVRSRDGSALTWGMAAVRWCGAAIGMACGGIGIVWALFEPRRRGWADLFSNTVIAERARDGAGDSDAAPLAAGGVRQRVGSVDNPRGRGYHARAVQGRDSSAGRATD